MNTLTVTLVALFAPTQAFSVTKLKVSSSTLYMSSNDDKSSSSTRFVERGVSVDQDGKSNVWAIEPKMEVDTKSAEEKSSGVLVAVGGVAAFAAVAAGILANLPDPNQF